MSIVLYVNAGTVLYEILGGLAPRLMPIHHQVTPQKFGDWQTSAGLCPAPSQSCPFLNVLLTVAYQQKVGECSTLVKIQPDNE